MGRRQHILAGMLSGGVYFSDLISFHQGQLNNPQLSQLAEKMMEKIANENKIKTSETLLFCITLEPEIIISL